MSEPFDLVTTVSPDFRDRFESVFRPTWENAGAQSIIVHEIDEGSWPGNIRRRAEVLRDEALSRLLRFKLKGDGELESLRPENCTRWIALDADCIVLRSLDAGFADGHMLSVARWPNVNMGVAFYHMSEATTRTWEYLLDRVVANVSRQATRRQTRDPNPMLECDQAVWRPFLHGMEQRVWKLPEWIWNYSNFDLPQWKYELPDIRNILRVLHIKGHGNWAMAQLDEKVAYAKTLWPEELACIG